MWIGGEMIVWGGSVWSGDRTAAGGRYDPDSDTWRPLSLTDAPEPRFRHTAVWSEATGEMIVWGGNSATETLASGGRYRPATDSWAATSLDGAPSPRLGHSAVWSGHHMLVWAGEFMLVWGGNARFSGLTHTGGTYTPAVVPTVFTDDLEDGDFRRWTGVLSPGSE